MNKAQIFVATLTLLMSSAIQAAAATTCEVLFVPARVPVQTDLRGKFLKSDDAKRWLALTNLRIGTVLRMRFLVRTPEGETKPQVIAATNDLILKTLRRPDVVTIEELEIVDQQKRPRFFSAIGINPKRDYGTHFIGRKFKRTMIYQDMRQAFLASPDFHYKLLVSIGAIDRRGHSFAQFLSDVRDLGLDIDESGLPDLPNSQQRENRLRLSGSIEALHEVIRHPLIKSVLDFETQIDEQTLQADMRRSFQGAARIHVFDERTSRPPSNGRDYFGVRDRTVKSFIRLHSDTLTTEIPHEERTAVDYARFIHRYHGHDFGYISEMLGKSVPAFDGIVLSSLQRPLANVSLKFQPKGHRVSLIDLVHEIELHLTKHITKKRPLVADPAKWFSAFLSVTQKDSTYLLERYNGYIQQAVETAVLFGILDEASPGMRPERIVIDMRDHGYSFGELNQTAVRRILLAKFRKAVEAAKSPDQPLPPLSVTLLWSDDQGVEIDADGVRVYGMRDSAFL